MAQAPPDHLTPDRAYALAKRVRANPGEKITRDAFLYMEPPDGDSGRDFAQCCTCALRVGGRLRCAVMGGRAVAPVGTCGLYVKGRSTHASIADLSPREIGYTVRKVRCENCYYGGSPSCALYAQINKAMPKAFDLDPRIKPKACCNANTPK